MTDAAGRGGKRMETRWYNRFPLDDKENDLFYHERL